MTDNNNEVKSWPDILQSVHKHNFRVFTGPYNMNIVGVRNANGTPNLFDDKIYVVYQDQDLNWICEGYDATTDAGLYFMNKPMRASGTAVLIDPYQYRGVFMLGRHKNVYPCLIQSKPMAVWRDSNKNDIIDEFKIGSATAIQIHRASSRWKSQKINNWSAGCQVIADPKMFESFMNHVMICLDKRPTWRTFTYTLIKSEI